MKTVARRAPRRRYWFKVADSILRESWDDHQLATLIRLMAWLAQRWARDGVPTDQAGSAVIAPHDHMAITHRSHPGYSRTYLETLADLVDIAFTPRPDLGSNVVEIYWPKFASFQGWTGDRGASVAISQARKDKDKDKDNEKDKKSAPRRAPACRSCGAKDHPAGRHPMPRGLGTESTEALLRWAGENGWSKKQASYATARVRDWADAEGREKACWIATIRNAMRKGWALDGHGAPTDRRPGPRRASEVVFGTPGWCSQQSPPVDSIEYGHSATCAPDCEPRTHAQRI